jgi:hypothetical protein
MLDLVFPRTVLGPMLQIRGAPLGDEMHDIARSIWEVLGPTAVDLMAGMVLNTFWRYLLRLFMF